MPHPPLLQNISCNRWSKLCFLPLGYWLLYAGNSCAYPLLTSAVIKTDHNQVDVMGDKDGLWQFVEAIVPQAYLFDINIPAVVRPTLTKLLVLYPFLAYNGWPSTILIYRDVVFVQETPSRQPITSYMDNICRPLLMQNRVKNEDLRIALIECKTAGKSRSSMRFADLIPFGGLRDWRAVDFPWVTEDGSIVVATLNALKRIHKSWTPGALSVVIYNVSTFDFRPGRYYCHIGFTLWPC